MEKHAEAYRECTEGIASALELLDDLLEIVGDIEDVVGSPGTPCPVQSQTAIEAIRKRVAAYEQATCPPGEAEPGASGELEVVVNQERPHAPEALPYIGPSPYCAELVDTYGPTRVWVGKCNYATVDDAVKAVLDAAKDHRLPVDPLTRHWVTKNQEHMVDFGSHTVYGRITSAGRDA